jgi:hypothetical protein
MKVINAVGVSVYVVTAEGIHRLVEAMNRLELEIAGETETRATFLTGYRLARWSSRIC